MPTISQLIRKGRIEIVEKTKTPALQESPAEARCLHPCVYVDPEEAEFGPSESGSRAPDQSD